MSKVTPTTLKQYLQQRSQVELTGEIADLFSRLTTVKEYYQLKLSSDENAPEVLDKYKAIIKKEFFPARGHEEARLSVARKEVTDYKKLLVGGWGKW